MSTNKNDAWVNEIKFILDECTRLSSIVATDFKGISRDDTLHSLPHPDGRGNLICGQAASDKLRLLAQEAARRNGLARQIEESTIRRPLENLLVGRFMKEARSVEIAQVDRLFSAAAKQARSKLLTTTHFVPCHLISASDPDCIAIGPITFHNRKSFRALLLKNARDSKSVERDEKQQLRRGLFARAVSYYRNFRWVAEVTVADCDAATSAEVAKHAVIAALDCIHLLFGFERTHRMQVGGLGLRADRRASLTVSTSGFLEPSLSSSLFGHVEYADGWSKALNNDGWQSWVSLFGVALEAAVDPKLERPLSQRFLDAAQWFGEACREDSASTRTVKFMTSVERLLTTGERGDISKMMAERTANLCFHPDGMRQEWREKTTKAYDYRSRLVHGSMAPRDPATRVSARLAAEVSQTVLLRALDVFGEKGLRAPDMSEKRLAKWFEEIDTWANAFEASHAVGRDG
jgi:Apea-like HEPN